MRAGKKQAVSDISHWRDRSQPRAEDQALQVALWPDALDVHDEERAVFAALIRCNPCEVLVGERGPRFGRAESWNKCS